jgi:transcriptional regulator with XRE-family HTH domain
MSALLTLTKAQTLLAASLRERRLALGLTQEGLSLRSGVPLPTVRKFEPRGVVSLKSFLKLLMVLGALEAVVAAAAPVPLPFGSMDELLAPPKKPVRKKGWRT